jgi:transcriptional regulator with XRE-family HTH domain
MAKVQVHIGKKIKEVLKKTPISVVDFAKSINLSRNGAYKIFEKETIDTGQLQTISRVLNHEFFQYLSENPSSPSNESKSEFGYATKSEVADLAHAILKLTIAVERIEEQLPKKKAAAKKKYGKKNT